MKKIAFVIAAIVLCGLAFSQNPEKPRLISGPFAGAVTKNSAKVWIAYRGNGQNMLTLLDTSDNTTITPTGFHKINDDKGNTALVMDFTDLQPEHTYKAVVAFDLLNLHPKCFIKTQADTAVKDLNFILGSCALLNTGFSRLIFPGSSSEIFGRMKRQRSEFMVWLGDNVYYFHKHYGSYQGMFGRNLKIRRGFISLSGFLAAQPNYAIWDDHDYGWNDSDKKFPQKDSSLIVFKGFWPNPYAEKEDFKGNYFTFRYYDAEFFMTDDRWFRDSEGDTAGAYLGKEQLAWLKDKLLHSDATFKFICTGSQVLNDSYFGESYAKYPHERNNLFDFIATNNIKGVIFLTGDKHYSELSLRNWKGYPLYDFTSSPITSPVVPAKFLGFYHNSYSVPGSILYRKNFGKISLTGPVGNRSCKMEIYGRGGHKKWEYIIDASELQNRIQDKKSVKGVNKKHLKPAAK